MVLRTVAILQGLDYQHQWYENIIRSVLKCTAPGLQPLITPSFYPLRWRGREALGESGVENHRCALLCAEPDESTMMRAKLRVLDVLELAIIKSFKYLKNKDFLPGRGIIPAQLLIEKQIQRVAV